MIRRIVSLGVLAGAAGAVARLWPDLQRYLKIRKM